MLLLLLAACAPPPLVCAAADPAPRCAHAITAVDRLHPRLSQPFRDALAGGRAVALDGLRARQAALTPSGPALSVATLNIGLLSLWGRYSVPRAEERRAALGVELEGVLAARAPVAMAIQECYREDDRALVRLAADRAGYDTVDVRPSRAPGTTPRKTGLVILVRREGLRARTDGYLPLPADVFRVAGYVRGVLWSRLTLADGTDLVVTNVHLSPLSRRGLSWSRTREVLALTDAARAGEGPFACRDAPNPCTIVWTGDYNLAPDHVWPSPDQHGERWLRWDHRLYDTLALAMDGEAELVAPGLVTLDPANALWAEGGLPRGEPARRVELAYVSNAIVEGAEVVFDRVLEEGWPVSDHYGLLLRFRPALRP